MTYIITALDAEAKAIVDYYRLKRIMPLPYTLYEGEEKLLLVTGMGKSNALMALSALLGWRRPEPNDVLINIGICGAPEEYEIGETLLIHQIIEGERCYYPDILYTHTLKESSLICVDAPQSSPSEFPVDMESAGVFLAGSKFFKLHRMAFLKIVSDHCNPDKVTKEGVIEAIGSQLKTLDELIGAVHQSCNEISLFTPDERAQIEAFKTHFTKSQGDALEDVLCFFRLKNRSRTLSLPSDIGTSKRERSMLLEECIATLTA